MSSGPTQAVRLTRAALRRITSYLSGRTIAPATPISQWTARTAVDDSGAALLALAAITLGGLLHPADALVIALNETDQRRIR